MINTKDIFNGVSGFADSVLNQFLEDRKLLRSLFLEEAEKQDAGDKKKITELIEKNNFGQEEEKDIANAFESELRAFIDGWYKKNICGKDESDVVHKIAFSIDENSRRNIEARLVKDRKDVLRDIVTKCLWNFSDILYLDDRAIQKMLREVDCQDLAKALKGVNPRIIHKITKNMSKTAADMLLEDMEFMGPIRLVDVEEAQELIITTARKLEEDGEIIFAKTGIDDELVR